MRRSAISATLCLAALAGSGALANDQLYKCVDSNGTLLLSDKPCAVVLSVAADTSGPSGEEDVTEVPTDIAAAPEEEAPRRVIVKERYTLPPAEFDRSQWNRKPPASVAPKIDVATLKAAKLNLELSEKTASLR
ncbi:DUF4124 domain-containing protein [Massilia sp. YMA4]|uniref:DUF4124 domain-containing protein n=1 Tax=Massilia sp. YMA4 TaxID=1593482 RepID=UPI000DD12191|nr:DUF4124 domain-containing protein [Massilia sp. YMA4]AXA92064.1 hypothetical protein DPH57_13430 [Massilia sp. YMA4]